MDDHVRILEKQWHSNPFKRKANAWYSWRVEHRDIAPDLRNAFLFKKDLREEDFSRADLRGANLVGAILRRADFRDANLSHAHLNSADLFRADLRNVDFTGADLTQVNFSASILDGANFEGAAFGGTIFGDIDLLNVRGLDSAIHRYRSTVGVDTLRKGCGKLPVVFLQGCGLSDFEIGTARLQNRNLTPDEANQLIHRLANSYVARVPQYYSCFISYSHADRSFACALYESLQRHGIQCWLDEKQLLPGDDIYDQVNRGIELWDKVLLCCSKHSLTSWWVDNEISAAFAKEQEIMKKRGKKVLALIPLNLDDYLFDWRNGKAKQVLTRLAAEFVGWEHNALKFQSSVESVVAALRLDAVREAPPEPML